METCGVKDVVSELEITKFSINGINQMPSKLLFIVQSGGIKNCLQCANITGPLMLWHVRKKVFNRIQSNINWSMTVSVKWGQLTPINNVMEETISIIIYSGLKYSSLQTSAAFSVLTLHILLMMPGL